MQIQEFDQRREQYFTVLEYWVSAHQLMLKKYFSYQEDERNGPTAMVREFTCAEEGCSKKFARF